MADDIDQFECRYVCTCGEWAFRVRYRRPDEDIGAWLEGPVRVAMGEAHSRNSPLCMSAAADLKLPFSEAQAGIGMKVVN